MTKKKPVKQTTQNKKSESEESIQNVIASMKFSSVLFFIIKTNLTGRMADIVTDAIVVYRRIESRSQSLRFDDRNKRKLFLLLLFLTFDRIDKLTSDSIEHETKLLTNKFIEGLIICQEINSIYEKDSSHRTKNNVNVSIRFLFL